MTVRQLIYMSQPFGFDATTLDAILLSSRRNNRRDDITGALIVRQDIYLQLLEGPAAALDAAVARISVDDRHAGMTILSDESVDARLFPEWAMRDDPARSWLWSPAEVAGNVVAAATLDDLRSVFHRVASAPPS